MKSFETILNEFWGEKNTITKSFGSGFFLQWAMLIFKRLELKEC